MSQREPERAVDRARSSRPRSSRPADAGAAVARHRMRTAKLGEEIAARFLLEHGVRILGRNLRVGRGEIDIQGTVGGVGVAVEVKTLVASTNRDDALDQFSVEKAETVRHYARRLDPPAYRVDLVAVTLRDGCVEIRWVPFAG